MLISFVAGIEYGSPDAGFTSTFGFLNSGRYFDTGSSSRNRPSSYSIMTATLVMGLVMEQMRNIASGRIGLAASRSIMPCDLNHATCPWRITRVTAPAMRLSSISCCTAVPMRSSRSVDSPTDSGLPVGRSCANAKTLSARKPRRTGTIFRSCPARELRRMLPPRSRT